MTSGLVFILVFLPMLLEAAVSARHERDLRALGAREPDGDVFRAMQVGYPALFLLMIVEGVWRGAAFDGVFWPGLAVFVAAKVLKAWAITSLGPRWSFRVLVPPGSSPVVSGPYRFLRHPNYLAVAGEMVGAALMAHALLTGPILTVMFALLMRRRIRVEEAALGLRRVESPR